LLTGSADPDTLNHSGSRNISSRFSRGTAPNPTGAQRRSGNQGETQEKDMDGTLMLVKPDAMQKGALGEILSAVQKEGFTVRNLKMLRLRAAEAKEFYSEHRERPFFNDLVEFMTSGEIAAIALERNDAVATLRKLIGATDSRLAEPGTIRARFGTDNQMNAVHASDSISSARRELAFFFSTRELIPLPD